MKKRVFLIVLDSVGIGEMPDAADYGDAGSNTVFSASTDSGFFMPNMSRLGFFNIDGVRIADTNTWYRKEENPTGAVCRMKEASKGKDTTIGHWEIAGDISPMPLPTFPDGFPQELIDALAQKTGRGILCNRPYSGTEVIKDFGEEHIKTGALIVYTSADSVLQIAAHEDIVPIDELYRCCEAARNICRGSWGVGRVIARPFVGEPGCFSRTSRRHDYSLVPPKPTVLDSIRDAGMSVIAVGKINDIFAGQGITRAIRTIDNADGIEQTIGIMKEDFCGLCFTNLVDFDMKYGHRNDVKGYAEALSYFDSRLPELLAGLKKEDILMITADHGCDPATPSTDHSREYTPLVIYGDCIRAGANLGTRGTFADIGAAIADYFGVKMTADGDSFLTQLLDDDSPS